MSPNLDLSESLYLPGRWSAVVTSHAVLLVEPGLTADELWAAWHAAGAGCSATDLLAIVTAGRASVGPPAFALAVFEGDCVRVVARPGVPVGMGDERGPYEVVARGLGRPWAEEVIPVPRRLWLGRASATASPDVLPVGTGIVLADVLAWAPGRHSQSPRSGRRSARHDAGRPPVSDQAAAPEQPPVPDQPPGPDQPPATGPAGERGVQGPPSFDELLHDPVPDRPFGPLSDLDSP